MLIELLHIHTLERKLLRLGPLSKALPKRRLRLRQAVGIRHPNKGPVITEAINDSQLVASLLPSALGTRCEELGRNQRQSASIKCSKWHRPWAWQSAYASVCRFQSMLSGMLSRKLSAASALRCSVQSARAAWRESSALSRALFACALAPSHWGIRLPGTARRARAMCASPLPRLLNARALVCRLPVLPTLPVRPPACPLASPAPATPPTAPPSEPPLCPPLWLSTSRTPPNPDDMRTKRLNKVRLSFASNVLLALSRSPPSVG